jgi:hypothetical protein
MRENTRLASIGNGAPAKHGKFSSMQGRETTIFLLLCATLLSTFAVAEGAGAAPAVTVSDLPASFYQRPGLEGMPRFPYHTMPVVNVRDMGAKGNGEDDDHAAFDHALDAVLAKGGGIIFIPKGIYVFKRPPSAKSGFWPITRPGRTSIANVHFVGEGEESVIKFVSPIHDQSYGWNFGNVENVSLRDMSFTSFPLFCTRGDAISRGMYLFQFGSYTPGQQYAHHVEMINVSTDQGIIGPLVRRGADDIWIVDCKSRNSSADGIHADTAQHVTVAYNWVENTGDDSMANISVAAVKNPAVDNHYYYNTSLGSQCRGLALGGMNGVAMGNWFERSQLPAIYLHPHGHRPVEGDPIIHPVVSGNTMVRCNLQNSLHRYPGVILGEFNVSDAEITDNLIVGCLGSGVAFRVFPTFLYHTGIPVFVPRRIAITNNAIEDNTGYGVEFQLGTEIDGLTITGNRLLGDVAGSAQFAGKVMAPNFAANMVDRAPVESTLSSLMDFSGKTQEALKGFQTVSSVGEVQYPDYYAEIGAMPVETGAVPLPPAGSPTGMMTLNVRSYGAKGDGATNDTAAFARAINALPADGGVLDIPAGNYLLTPIAGNDKPAWTCLRDDLAIVDRSNIHLRGDGMPQLIFTDADAQGLRLIHVKNSPVSGIAFRLRTQPRLRHDRALLDLSACEGVSLDGVETGNSSGPGIDLDASRMITLEHCNVANAGTNGVAILSSSQVLVENCTFIDSRDCAVRIDQTGSVTRRPQFVRVDHNSINGVREGFGIAVCTGDEIEASGNQIADCYQAGVAIFQQEGFLPPPRSVVIAGNTLTRCNGGPYGYTDGAISVFGVRTDGGGDFCISGNTIENTPHFAISIERDAKLDHVIIAGNIVRDAKLGATSIADAQKTAIQSLTLTQ